MAGKCSFEVSKILLHLKSFFDTIHLELLFSHKSFSVLPSSSNSIPLLQADNSPPGPANAFDCGRGKDSNGQPIAGGSGTYTDPISFATATDNSAFPQCGLIYVPALHKYFRNEDNCAECKSDYDTSKQYHVDLWTGSNTQGGGDAQVRCEGSLPVNGPQTIINDPPPNLPVDTGLLFDVSSGACSTMSYRLSDGASLCAGAGGGFGPPLSTLVTTTSSAVAAASSTGQTACVWQGHCLGAPCQTYNDCDGTDICGANSVCVPVS